MSSDVIIHYLENVCLYNDNIYNKFYQNQWVNESDIKDLANDVGIEGCKTDGVFLWDVEEITFLISILYLGCTAFEYRSFKKCIKTVEFRRRR